MRKVDHLYNSEGQLLLDQVYDEYNRLYFGGKLPRIPVKWSRSRVGNCYGICTDDPEMAIFVHPSLKKWFPTAKHTVLHEMVHVEQWGKVPENYHGPKFQNRMKKLVRQGAFDNLW